MEDGTQDDYPLDELVTEFPVETLEVPNDEVKVSKEIEAATEELVENPRGRKKKPGRENGVKRRQNKDR